MHFHLPACGLFDINGKAERMKMIRKIDFVTHKKSLLIGVVDMSVCWFLTQIRSEINSGDCCPTFLIIFQSTSPTDILLSLPSMSSAPSLKFTGWGLSWHAWRARSYENWIFNLLWNNNNNNNNNNARIIKIIFISIHVHPSSPRWPFFLHIFRLKFCKPLAAHRISYVMILSHPPCYDCLNNVRWMVHTKFIIRQLFSFSFIPPS